MKLSLKKVFSKDNIPYFVICGIIFVSFIISMTAFLVKSSGTRRCFIFPSVENNKYVVESRYLSNKLPQGKINVFIEELLLGSSVERTKMIFTPGTKVNSCFLRDGTLYLDLSSDLLIPEAGVIPVDEGYKLLKKNVSKNFHSVKKIMLFVDGKIAYEEVKAPLN